MVDVVDVASALPGYISLRSQASSMIAPTFHVSIAGTGVGMRGSVHSRMRGSISIYIITPVS